MRPPPSLDPHTDIAEPTRSPEEQAQIRRQRTLDALEGVNAQLLDLLCAQAREAVEHFPFSEPVRSRLAILTDHDRSQMARFGVLLVDAGFSDPYRWLTATAGAAPRDADPLAEPATHWLPEKDGVLLVHSTLLVAWSVLQWKRDEAALLLGMCQETADLIATLGVKQLSEIAQHRWRWVQPRWTQIPHAWVDLMEFAQKRGPLSASYGTLRCLQLTGGHSRLLDTHISAPTR
jgi:hypothetical protein